MKKLRVLFMLGSYKQGGAERQAVILAKKLKENGHTPLFSAFSDEGPVKEQLSILGIKYEAKAFDFFFIDNFKKFSLNKESISYRSKFKKQTKEYAAYLDSFEADVLMPYTFYPNVVAGCAFPYTNALASVWNQRDIGTEGMKGYYCEKVAVKNTSHFVANSGEGIELLKKTYALKPDNLNVIHNGVEEANATKNTFPGISSNAYKVIMLGNFHPNKDHATLIKAWRTVLDSLKGKKLQLVLAGRFTGGEKQLLDLASGLHIENGKEIIFMDSVKDVHDLLSSCNLAVLSSHSEGLPNAVLEAMACGLPVVATNNRGCCEALGDNYPFLATSADSHSLADKLIELINNTELSHQIGNKNKTRITEHFSTEQLCNSYLSLFEKIT